MLKTAYSKNTYSIYWNLSYNVAKREACSNHLYFTISLRRVSQMFDQIVEILGEKLEGISYFLHAIRDGREPVQGFRVNDALQRAAHRSEDALRIFTLLLISEFDIETLA